MLMDKSVLSLSFSRDGDMLAGGSAQGQIKVTCFFLSLALLSLICFSSFLGVESANGSTVAQVREGTHTGSDLSGVQSRQQSIAHLFF